MKTINIAIEYLSFADFSKVDMLNIDEAAIRNIGVFEIKKRYDSDSRNTVSNSYYRDVCFEVAMYHLLDNAHGITPSCFEVACDIVKKHKDSKSTEKWGNTNYPKVMFDEWDKYCAERDPKPAYLSEGSEMRVEAMMCAYEYITNEKS